MQPYESIKTYMTTNLITFNADTDIREAMNTLLKSGISGAPVLDAKGNLIGVISEKDCMKVIVNKMYHNEPGAPSKVGDYMSGEVKTIDARLSVTEAAYEFLHCNYRRFPVMENGKLVGQVSRRDILKGIITIEDRNQEAVPSSWAARKPVEIASKTTRYNKKK
ncbi:MAG: CBS domain-containing protein, partial [Chitinophagales bacterium]